MVKRNPPTRLLYYDRAILADLEAADGRFVSTARLIQVLYPNPDQEPLDARLAVRRAIRHLRDFGYMIESQIGKRSAGYRIGDTQNGSRRPPLRAGTRVAPKRKGAKLSPGALIGVGLK